MVTLPDGTRVPALGQGTWRMGEDARARRDEVAALRLGIELGMTLIDTAEMYGEGGAEEVVGEAIAGRRDDLFIVSKVYPHNAGRRGVVAACERSLDRLGIETIDLYQSHWDDPTTPFDETLEAYQQLLSQGKVRAIGASNLTAARLSEALFAAGAHGLPKYRTLQPLYNLYDRSDFEGALADVCMRENLGVIPYYSLAAGFLTGKYRSEADYGKSARGPGMRKYLNPRGLAIVDALVRIADAHRATPAQVALAWLMTRPAVTAPIASATSVAQLEELVGATRLTLGDDDLAALDRASAPS